MYPYIDQNAIDILHTLYYNSFLYQGDEVDTNTLVTENTSLLKNPEETVTSEENIGDNDQNVSDEF